MTYSAFYIDMNELFEKYVERKLIEISNMVNNGEDKDEDGFCKIRELILEQLNGNENKSYYIETQNQGHYYLDDKKVFKIKPDFLIKNNKREVIAVADAKYKRLNNNKEKNYGISSSDVYQLLSYSYKFNTNTIILIYPKPPNYYENDLNFTLKIDNSNSKTLHICYIDLISEKN
ncbi:MAG TPA: hypothetical protein PKY56_06645, partial [Candidatus Kapabacteria bacterium]|nr:hypothetical protein [Candidatus Kapabacteria bacterium]